MPVYKKLVKHLVFNTSCVFFCFIVDQVTKDKDTRDKLIKATGEFRWVKYVEIKESFREQNLISQVNLKKKKQTIKQ